MGSPLQNRVTPLGELEAVKARGAWLGNRGILHNDQQEIVAPWRHKAWVTCKLEFKGRKRSLFSPRSYSELFFLDEATAFSAGHRPCGECQRDKYRLFKAAWCTANQNLIQAPNPLIVELDKHLHSDRALTGGKKVTYTEKLRNLPDGIFVKIEDKVMLLANGHLHVWSHTGYIEQRSIQNSSSSAQVLTPKSIVAAFRIGLKVEIHESAR